MDSNQLKEEASKDFIIAKKIAKILLIVIGICIVILPWIWYTMG